MDDGEYRSHLYFRAEKTNEPLGQENDVKDSSNISVKLEAVFGISIATIIRKGKSNTTTTISDLNFINGDNPDYFLSFQLNRKGNMSTYGKLTINYISRENEVYEVAMARGLAVYTPGEFRKVKMKLQKPGGITFNGGKFTVVYTEHESENIIAEAEIQL